MNIARTVGYWSALGSLLFAIGYCIPQLLSTFKIIPHPQDLAWLFLPSLFLAPFFLVTMISVHFFVSAETKIWTGIGVAFAVIYATCATIVYFTQLTVVIPQLLKSEIDESHVLAFRTRSFLMAVDCLGYFFMSLSTLFAAMAFIGDQYNKWLYRSLLYNGSLLPVLILAFFYPFFYYVGALWMITFPMAMLQVMKFFKKDSRIILQPKKLKYEIE